MRNFRRRAFLAFQIGRGFHLVAESLSDRKYRDPRAKRVATAFAEIARQHTKVAIKKPLDTTDTCTFGETAFSLLTDNTRIWYRLPQMLLNTVLYEMASRPFDNIPILYIYFLTSTHFLPPFIISMLYWFSAMLLNMNKTRLSKISQH